MIGLILFLCALGGTSYAAWRDLKTTEVSDWVSIILASVGIGLNFLRSFLTGDWSFLINSLLIGSAFLGFGFLMYLGGMWGGADALILGAVGYTLPYIPELFNPTLSPLWPYPISFLVNLFLIGAIYASIFSIYVALDQNVFPLFLKELTGHKGKIMYIVTAYIAIFSVATFFLSSAYGVAISYFNALYNVIFYSGAIFSLLILYVFFKTIENHSMVREISTEDLKPGDVIAEDIDIDDRNLSSKKIKGLSEEQVEKIKDRREKIKVKEGVRFILVFPLSILVTFLIGDILYGLLSTI